jgi:cell division protein FtsA
MAKPNIITGLDIGSSAVKILVAAKKENVPDFETLFRAEEFSLGVRRGVVVDVNKVSRIIQILIERARVETGQKINSVFVNIGGSHLSCISSRGMVAVSRADRKISKGDVERVLQEAVKTAALPSNHESLEIFSKEFIVDGVGGIKSVEDLQGARLEAEVLILSSFLPYKNNLVQAVLDAGLHISDITPSPIADSFVVLSQRQKELGAAILNIGAGTSELAVFEEGELSHLAVFPIGSSNITSDIAVGLKTDIDIAESIKLKLGSCFFKGKDKKEKINGIIEGEEPLVFSQKMLTMIIEARISEIFEEAQKELKKISKRNLLAGGVVLTGGGAKMSKIVELARKEFKLSSRIGKNSFFPELEDEPGYSSLCGLVFKGADLEESGSWRSITEPSGRFRDKIKRIFKNFLP